MKPDQFANTYGNTPASLLRPKEAAKYLRLSESKLAKLRMAENRAKGPRFVKLAGCVVYRLEDLDQWVNAHVVGC